MKPFRFEVRFWGVRGSIPTPQRQNLEFGGNTTCVEVRLADGPPMVIDGGTGIRALGSALQNDFPGGGLSLHVFLTHFHWDHIQGLPFFGPLYDASNSICFHSGRHPENARDILEGQMSQPYFPVQFEFLHARREFAKADSIHDSGLRVKAFPLNHPQAAVGYRFELDGAVLVHASDCEHGDKKLDPVLRDYAQGADVLIYDSQYTPEEYESKRGWGHSTWLEATKIAKDAGVKHLVLFHHDPMRNDTALRELELRARECFENTTAAQEGASIQI